MGLVEEIGVKMVAAMKAKQEPDLSVLRMLKTAFANKEIELRKSGKEFTEEEAQKVIKMQVKQVKDARSEFSAANREDLVAQSTAELVVLERFMPEQMNDEQIRAIITAVIAKTESPSIGSCMGLVMQKVAGQADGSRVRELLQEALS